MALLRSGRTRPADLVQVIATTVALAALGGVFIGTGLVLALQNPLALLFCVWGLVWPTLVFRAMWRDWRRAGARPRDGD